MQHLDVQQIASIQSMGDAYEKALMESIIGLHKVEYINTDLFQAPTNPRRRQMRHNR